MKATSFDNSLLSLFDAPAPKERTETTIKLNMKMRYALQDAKAWYIKQPKAFAALDAIFAKHDVSLKGLLGIKVIPESKKGNVVTPAHDDITDMKVPNTADWDLTDQSWADILNETAPYKAAFEAFLNSLDPEREAKKAAKRAAAKEKAAAK